GIRHIALGADHLVFLAGLLLLGATKKRLVNIAAAFVTANVVAFVLTVFNLMRPPAYIVEPALALAIVYIGADNLLVRGGRDMRVWIAFAFGLIHGFWFANGLRAMDLPLRTLGWSLLSFDLGVEFTQVLLVLALGSALTTLRERMPMWSRPLTLTGSVA